MVRHFALKLTILAVIVCFVNPMVATCDAGPILPTPAGLTLGETFRFAFVTDGSISAFSGNIATYDTFVNQQAHGATYAGHTVTWQAIGSTSRVNAIDHIGVHPAIQGIFLVSGTEVSPGDGTSGLWSGSLISPIDKDINGATAFSFAIYTGTSPHGVALHPLGGFPSVVFGDSADSNSRWVDLIPFPLPFIPERMYGISQVLTVVPEPSGGLLAVIGGLIGPVLVRFRKSRKEQSHRVP